MIISGALASVGAEGGKMFESRFRNETASIWMDDARCLVRLRRSSHRVERPDEMATAMQTLIDELDRLVPLSVRGKWGLLQDMRDAPLLTDPALEQAVARHAGRLRQGWLRLAVLVRTPVGKLQVRRTTTNEQAAGRDVFDDEIEALNYLTDRA